MSKIIGIKLLDDWLAVIHANRQVNLVQTTRLYGDALLFSAYGTNQADHYRQLMRAWANQPMMWAELAEIPRSAALKTYRYAAELPPELPPIAKAQLVLKDADWDPTQGYWLEFGIYPKAFPFSL